MIQYTPYLSRRGIVDGTKKRKRMRERETSEARG